KLLDVGTGSGCIAITCALEKLSKKIYATDISQCALSVAHKNMQLHNINYIQTACHDILNNSFQTKFDVLISNPPYVSINEIESLHSEVKDYDPRIALTDGADGFVFYRRYANKFDDLLNPGGHMLLEISGKTHKEGIEKIFSDAEFESKFYKDLQGDFRVVEIHR
ncbi:uncharacterized protein METZ01_LOCUS501518, partial [marine metagenome]